MRHSLLYTVVFCVSAAALSGCSKHLDAGSEDAAGVTISKVEETISPATGDTIEVWKDPSCGCCKSWIEHMRKHGFTVVAHDEPDMTPVKQAHGIGADLASCHTATIHGYAIEGHVPADLVRKVIIEKPKIAGLAVPGMPMGSPGMETMGMQDKYDVIAFTKDGSRSVYASR